MQHPHTINETVRLYNVWEAEHGDATPVGLPTSDLIDAANTCLAVYGSLMPGRKNHYLVADLEGVWESGIVRGQFFDGGWSEGTGYPYIHWDPAGDIIPVAVLISDALPLHWGRLDAFEGDGYRRILAPVFQGDEVRWVANIYQSADYPVH